jgi:hypothetical protein
MHRIITRLTLTSLIAVAAFASSAAVTANAATAVPASSGGGCHSASSQGYRVSACISAHNGVVYPDYYVTNLPTNGCSLFWWVWHNGNIVYSGQGSCAVGHKNLPGGSGSGSWYDEVFIYPPHSGWIVLDVDSPIEFN